MFPTELYRHFDIDGNLLYIGISLSTLTRLQNHRSVSHWFPKITSITIERFDDRNVAIAAEAKAIKNEKPLFNRAMNEAYEDYKINEKLQFSRECYENRFLKTAEVAAILCVRPNRLSELVRKKRCPIEPIPEFKTRYRWRQSTVFNFIINGGRI